MTNRKQIIKTRNINYVDSWKHRMLDLAEHISHWSKDPSTKVGAVIADRLGRVVSVGYNGFPLGIEDNEHILNHANKTVKYQRTIHADMNAILFANRSLEECTMYTYPMLPCSRCATYIIQAGIEKVVSIDTIFPERWKDEIVLGKQMFNEAGVDVELLSRK